MAESYLLLVLESGSICQNFQIGFAFLLCYLLKEVNMNFQGSLEGKALETKKKLTICKREAFTGEPLGK